MKSPAIAVIAGALILVVVVAVLIRVQRPSEVGRQPAAGARLSRATAGPNRAPGVSARREPVEERLRQLREQHAERRRLKTPAAADSPPVRVEPQPAAGRRGRIARDLPEHQMLDEDEMEVPALENTLLTHPDPEERAGAAFFLSASDDEGNAYRALLRGLNDPDTEVRLSVIEALEDFDELVSVDALGPALGDPEAEVRFEAVSLLGDLDTPEAVAAVRELLEDPDEDVRTLAEGIVEMAE